MLLSKVTGRVVARLRNEFSRPRFESRLDGLSFIMAIIVSALLALLAVRAAVRLEVRWDTFWYHIPFAAIRGGIAIPFEVNEYVRGYFEGFPPLPHIVQGILWRITGSINATGVVNYGALMAFLIFCSTKLKAPFWLVAMWFQPSRKTLSTRH